MIAVDAMGGDFAPQVVVQGALYAARFHGVSIHLFGDKEVLEACLDATWESWRTLSIIITHCSQRLEMVDEPSRSVLQKKDSSLVKAVQAVAQNQCEAVVSAGNSGAMLVASTLLIGRIPGILRPAIGSFIPAEKRPFFCLDLGANVDCKPEYLEQFAYMGHAYVSGITEIKKPRVALLSNGHEPYKGSDCVKTVYDLLLRATHIDFIGNKEARDIFDGSVDVVVCDGFTGNVLLKTAQGVVKTFLQWLSQEASQSVLARLMLTVSYPIMKRLKARADYSSIGGGILLGVQKPVIIAHGSSNAKAIMQAILFAQKAIKERHIERFKEQLDIILMNHASYAKKVLFSNHSSITQTQ